MQSNRKKTATYKDRFKVQSRATPLLITQNNNSRRKLEINSKKKYARLIIIKVAMIGII